MDFSAVASIFLWFIGTILIAFGCLFLCFMLYLHYVHKQNAHLPGPPRSSFILGNLPDFWKYKKATGKTMIEYVTEKRLVYGPIFLMTYFDKCVVYLGGPDYIKEVFINNHRYLRKPPFLYNKMGFIFGARGLGYGIVTNTDELSWHKKRHIMNPAFHRKCLKDFMTNFNNVTDRFLVHMGEVAVGDKAVSMVEEFAKATLETICEVSFNINTNAIKNPESTFSSAIRNYLRGAEANIEYPISSIFLGIFQFKLFQKPSQGIQINAARFLRKFASNCITTRMNDIAENKVVPNDLLNLLINDGSLTREEIIDEFITVLIAGQDTTTSSLAFALYEILTNPHVEAKLLNEIKEVLGERQEVRFDDLAKLKYMGQVLEENLRKHPISVAPFRVLEKEITVGGYRIPKGNWVVGSSLMFGMNPEIWKDPEVFDPERFADAGNIPNLSMIHFPFSVGPRSCIGQTFAKFESKVILAKLFQKFQFTLLPGQTDRIESRMSLAPRDGVMCKVRRRTERYDVE